MKKARKLLAVVLAVTVALTMGIVTGVTAFAAPVANEHTITINNSDANGEHSYEAYQVFKGNLNASEAVLSDIEWGNGVNSAGLIAGLIAANDEEGNALKGKFNGITATSTPTDVAKKIAAFSNNSRELDELAKIISENLSATKYAFSGTKEAGYQATVPNDGYYFIKDTTTSLPEGDTASKFMLNVVKDVTINAKDTSLAPDKEITGGPTNVKEGTAAIGDLVTFQVAIQVPDTTNYIDNFWFIMKDKLPAGMTFNEVTSIKTYAAGDIDTSAAYKVKANATATATITDYVLTVAAKNSDEYGAYTKPENKNAAVTADGGQKIKIVFHNFKTFAETKVNEKNHIGEYVVIEYSAYVNDDAQYGATGNKNEVQFVYSNDPNHDYNGDEPGPNSQDPTGETPKDETTTYVTALEILKVDGTNNNTALEGAEFEITGTAYNLTLVTGEKFVKDNENGTYWLLKDGSYTTQDPNAEGMNQTQYAQPITDKYKKEVVNKVVTTPTDTKITAISGADGKINISGLKPGTYTVKETKAPDGYNLDSTPRTLVIAWNKPAAQATNGGFSIGEGTTDGWEMTTDGALYKIRIQNNQGSTLPSTGGIGTTIFYILGALLVIGCGIVLIARRRLTAK